MRIVIFGSTGQVGRHLVSQALLNQLNVRAFGRNVHLLPDRDPKLKLVKGALFDDKEVQDAVTGCDAVLSVLGGSFDGKDKTRSLGMRHIIQGMKKAGVNRIIALGGQGVLDAPDGGLIMEGEEYPEEYLPVGMEHKLAWEYLAGSGLDWTFLCSPDIHDGDPTGRFLTAANIFPADAYPWCYSGDLALFMLQELERHAYSQERVGIGSTIPHP